VGLGVSAISRIGDSYSQNARDLVGYAAALDAGRLPVARGICLKRDDIVRRAVIGELMCHGELDMSGFGERYQLNFAEAFHREIDRLQGQVADGLVTVADGVIRVTPRGRLLLRNIAMCFDAYLHNDDASPRYSRTI
jgi:oxygen-independent coproporphyrinogen-3 oxidase